MKRILIAVVTSWLLTSNAPVWAQEVQRAPAPVWAAPLASTTLPPAPADDAPVRLLAIDDQVRFDLDGVHSYYARRTQVQTRQGLPQVSTVSAVWNPAYETVQVHAVRILRGDQVIDVLESQNFQIIQREDNLESSMLDGRLTATLQPRDLRVGDILETAFTIHDTGGVLAPHREYMANLNSGLVVEHYRLRASWPSNQTMKVASMAPWADVRPKRVGGDWVYEIDARQMAPERLPDNLPGRFTLTRLTELTDYADWSAPSAQMAPLYARASTLESDSPLKARIEAIRAAHATDAARAAAALRLVQDEVRYLALSMGEGGYVPTAADEVWRSRYGDCKGKTVLLLALLHGLGIEAEAALVSTDNGDGLPDRLPAMAWFDHVIVRAVVDGQTYWMDGTAVGDRGLDGLTPPPYRWALPVQPQGAALTPIEQPPARTPTFAMLSEVDASAGLDAAAPLLVDLTYFGDTALQMRRQMSAVTREQLLTAMKSSMEKDTGTTRVESVDTRYDDDLNAFHLIVRGTMRMGWVDGAGGGRMVGIPEVTVSIPYQDERKGLFVAYKDMPYALSHPYMGQTTIRVVLPGGGEGFRIEGGDQSVEAGGYRVAREASLQDGVATVVLTTTSLVPEISAEDMERARVQAKARIDTVLRLRAPAGYAATAADRARLEAGDDKAADLIERAEHLRDIGDTKGALVLLDAALEAEPDNAKARRTRGGVRLMERDYANARLDFDHAVDLDPVDVEATVGQGRVAMAEGRYAEAVVSYSVALRLDPGQATALTGRGAAYYQIGRWDRSLADYRAYKTATPSSDVGLYGELRALTRLGRTEEARTIIAETLKTKPENYTALDQLITLGRRENRMAETLAALDAGLSASPDNFGLLSLRGEARAFTGQADGARADFDAMRRLAGSDPLLMNNVCWSQGVSGFDLDQALADCDVAVGSGEAGVIDSRAMVLLQLERYADAKADYDQALAVAPNLSPSLYGRGLARLALGDAGGDEDLARARAMDVDAAENFAVFEARHPRAGQSS